MRNKLKAFFFKEILIKLPKLQLSIYNINLYQ